MSMSREEYKRCVQWRVMQGMTPEAAARDVDRMINQDIKIEEEIDRRFNEYGRHKAHLASS